MLDQITEDSEPAESSDEMMTKEEVNHLDSRLKEAMEALKGIRLGDKNSSDKQYLYQLPWYIIIGPPGAGKTTLLANSELDFPLSEKYGKDALHGVGGTRNCDWWFTNDAVLLDTAGRYTTQDSNKNIDKGSWLGFLDLLKKYRSRQPINGVVVAVSIVDMLQSSDDEIEGHAKAIRKRIAELYEHFDISIPVYLMFTKSDLLAGFSDYFDDLNKDSRKQVWGTTFPLDESGAINNAELFASEFELLEESVHQQLLQKLENERDLERRQAIYLFPQQFSSLKQRINGFVEKTFQASQFHKPLMLRGVYFTSATQEGSAIDRIMGSLASGFGIARQQVSSFSGKGKSYFINDLLKKVIFPESGLAGVNYKSERRSQWFRTGIGVAVAIASITMAGLWFYSYQLNKKVIADYNEQIAIIDKRIEAAPYKGTLADQLPLLNELRRLSKSYTDEGGSPSVFSRLGLYQGDSLRSMMDDRYREFLRKILRPHAKTNIEQQLKASLDKPSALFGLLKTYLYLGGKAPVGTTAPSLANIDWDGNGQSGDSQDVLLTTHFNAMLDQQTADSIQINDTLVIQSREILSEEPAKLAYIQLKNVSLNSTVVPDFKIIEQEGLSNISSSFLRKSGKQWLSGIPGLFTKEGFSKLFLPKYNDIVRNLQQDRWVLGDYQQVYTDTATIKLSIQQLYQDDYIQNWSDFLRDLKIKPLEDIRHAPEVLRPLTADSGNLLIHILKAVQTETDFSDDNKLPLIGNAIELKKTLKAVDLHFKPLHKVVNEEQLKETMQLLDALYKGLYQDISGGKDKSDQVKTTVSELNAAVAKLPEILRVWLNQTIQDTRGIIGVEVTKGTTKAVIAAAKEDLCEPCNTNFRKRYPFKKKASKGIDISEFNTFFSLGGTADSFARANLKDTGEVDAKVVATLKRLLADSERIRTVFFSTGNLNVDFEVQLISANPNVQKIQLSIGRTKNNFFPRSAVRPKEIYSWPASPITAMVTFNNPATPPRYITISDAKDQWGLFKMVKNDQIRLPALGNAVFSIRTPTLRESPFKLFQKLKSVRICRCPK